MKQIAGWSISIIFYALGAILPGSEPLVNEIQPRSGVSASYESLLVMNRMSPGSAELTKSITVNVLLASYSFGEKGERVSALQETVGTVRVDGDYGAITRREHIKVLKSLNLSVSGVPSIPLKNQSSGYNIPSDTSKRCPQWESSFAEIGLLPVDVFSYIAWRESGCRPSAQNATWDKHGNMTYHLNKDKSFDTGLLQINSTWKTVTKTVCGADSIENYMHGLKDPTCNMLVAKYLMDNSSGKLANWRIYKDK